jgi:four helix bundle protein
MRKYDLEERLIDYAVKMIGVSEKIPKNRAGLHISGQLVRSGTSPAYNYGEAQGAESRADFVHKMRICLKELRETRVGLLIIKKAKLIEEIILQPEIQECNELIAIFITSIKTATFPGSK